MDYAFPSCTVAGAMALRIFPTSPSNNAGQKRRRWRASCAKQVGVEAEVGAESQEGCFEEVRTQDFQVQESRGMTCTTFGRLDTRVSRPVPATQNGKNGGNGLRDRMMAEHNYLILRAETDPLLRFNR